MSGGGGCCTPSATGCRWRQCWSATNISRNHSIRCWRGNTSTKNFHFLGLVADVLIWHRQHVAAPRAYPFRFLSWCEVVVILSAVGRLTKAKQTNMDTHINCMGTNTYSKFKMRKAYGKHIGTVIWILVQRGTRGNSNNLMSVRTAQMDCWKQWKYIIYLHFPCVLPTISALTNMKPECRPTCCKYPTPPSCERPPVIAISFTQKPH